MDVNKQNNDLIKEIIEKHFENMVDDVLGHTETYDEALRAISNIKGWNIPTMLHLADCLGKAIRKRAMQQKTPNHQNQVLKERNMNELERTALNEILRTVTYIAEKLDEIENVMLTYQEAHKHPKD